MTVRSSPSRLSSRAIPSSPVVPEAASVGPYPGFGAARFVPRLLLRPRADA